MDFVGNLIANSVSGFVEAGTRTLGGYAGDALIKAGDVIENTGRDVGSKVENTAAYYGAKISGQAPPKTSSYTQKSLPTPKSQKLITYPYSGGAKSVSNKSSTGAYKKPAGSAVAVKSGAHASKAVVPYGGAKSSTSTTTAQKKPLPKAYPNNIAYPSTKAKSTSTTKSLPKASLPKPFPNNVAYPSAKANSNTKTLPKPYPENNGTQKPAYASNKKTPVTRGHTVPFTAKDNNQSTTQKSTQYGSTPAAGGNSNNTQKAYPGQGEHKRSAVKKYKAAERYKPPFEKGNAQFLPEIKV